ncbi:MAG: lyase family protein [Eggerthella lenta]
MTFGMVRQLGKLRARRRAWRSPQGWLPAPSAAKYVLQHRPVRRAVRASAQPCGRPAVHAGAGARPSRAGDGRPGCDGFHTGVHRQQVRLLQQSDVIEAEEPFTKGQKGSSAMPHKRNPITAERVCGLARVVKSNAQVAFDDVALWYERDISHSGAERVALADSFIALDYMFGKMQWMLDGLQTYPAKMEHNLWRTKGLIFSSKVLLALVDTGISREDAYVIVQRNAMKVWEDIQNAVDGPTYRENLEADPEANLSAEVLDEIFDPWDFLTRKDVVFDRLKELEF